MNEYKDRYQNQNEREIKIWKESVIPLRELYSLGPCLTIAQQVLHRDIETRTTSNIY